MAHTDIRTFDTRVTYPEQHLGTAMGFGGHDPAAQTNKVMQYLKHLIEARPFGVPSYGVPGDE